MSDRIPQAISSILRAYASAWVAPLLLLAGVAALGCGDSSSEARNQQAEPPPSPEIRFERFIEELELRLAGNRTPQVDPSTAFDRFGVSSSGEYLVESSKVIPPETEEGVYRAEVVIRVSSSLTVLNLNKPEPDEAVETNDPQLAPGEPATELDSDRIMRTEDTKPRAVNSLLSSPIHQRDHEVECTYYLTYVEGRWRLRDEIKDRVFLSNAFRQALKRQ